MHAVKTLLKSRDTHAARGYTPTCWKQFFEQLLCDRVFYSLSNRSDLEDFKIVCNNSNMLETNALVYN